MDKKRIQKLETKGLITDDNTTLYNQIESIYKKGFKLYLEKIISFSNLTSLVTASNCLFSPSKTCEEYNFLKLESPYFYLLNKFYIENISDKDLTVLKNKKEADEEVINIVSKTLKSVITKEGVKNITYFGATKETIIKNGTLVFLFAYGKNIKELSGDEYINNVRKQKAFINKLKEEFEKGIRSRLNIECKMLSYKML